VLLLEEKCQLMMHFDSILHQLTRNDLCLSSCTHARIDGLLFLDHGTCHLRQVLSKFSIGSPPTTDTRSFGEEGY